MVNVRGVALIPGVLFIAIMAGVRKKRKEKEIKDHEEWVKRWLNHKFYVMADS